jgi:proton-coupled amino acid transporter
METLTPGTAWQLSQYFDFPVQESSVWVVFIAPFLVPLMLLPFDKLHMTSLLADVSTLVSYGIVYYVDFSRLSHMETSTELTYVRFRGVPFFASVAMYCYEGAGLVLSLEHASYQGKSSEERRRHFPKMFIFSLVVITLCYIAFGVCGYAAFGNQVMAVITKNLGPGVLSYSIKGALSLSLYLTYPVVIHPIGQIIDTKVHRRVFMIRVLLVALTVFIVICVPSFSLLMELIGGSACALLSFVLPAYFHYKVMNKELTPLARRIDQFIIIFGTGIGIVCTAVVFSDLFLGESHIHTTADYVVRNVSDVVSEIDLADIASQAG